MVPAVGTVADPEPRLHQRLKREPPGAPDAPALWAGLLAAPAPHRVLGEFKWFVQSCLTNSCPVCPLVTIPQYP